MSHSGDMGPGDVDLNRLGLKLGKQTSEERLDPVPRALSRRSMSLPEMYGHDLWNAWEVGYLTPKGRPVVWHMQCVYAADTPNIVESKSFKLFLNARNNESFEDLPAFENHARKELTACVGGPVDVRFYAPETTPGTRKLQGICIDQAETERFPSEYDPGLLGSGRASSGEFRFHSHLLRSLCPVTAQPDWGAVEIVGQGPRSPEPAALLAYIVGLRNHQDFHEVCCERIYADLYNILKPDRLTVRCLYTRRGGLDICPVRSTHPAPELLREPVWRQ